MSLLGDDIFARGRRRGQAARPISARLPILILVSLGLIALSRLDHPTVKEIRTEIEAFVAPGLGAVLVPLDPVRRLVRQVQASYDGFRELERLRDENQRLRQWEVRARELERKVGELAGLARVADEHKLGFVTARVIATSSGPFMHSALLEAGQGSGIRAGHPVINADGVLGRIVEAGRGTSRVLLLTDINSRVPVLVGRSQTRAILVGDNSAEPRITFLPADGQIEPGAEIVTSGLGGMFPRGLHVGVARVGQDGSRAALATRLGDLEYVSILLHENPGPALAGEINAQVPSAPRRRPAERGPLP